MKDLFLTIRIFRFVHQYDGHHYSPLLSASNRGVHRITETLPPSMSLIKLCCKVFGISTNASA